MEDDYVKGASPDKQTPEDAEAPRAPEEATEPADGAAPGWITGKMVAERVRGLGRGPLGAVADELGLGSDEALRESHYLLAEHLHMAGVRVSSPDYLSIRNNDEDDGTYSFRDSVVVEAIDDEGLKAIELEARRQLPFEAESLVHAARAYALDPDDSRFRFLPERCLEGVLDAGGTILAVKDEQKSRAG